MGVRAQITQLPSLGALQDEPGVTASFIPETAAVGRPIIFRVQVSSLQRALEPPPLLPPDGLAMTFAGSSLGTSISNGKATMISTFNYTVVAQQPGRFVMPSFEIISAGQRVRTPPAILNVIESAPGAAAYQPVRAELDLPKRDFFTGETIHGRLLLIETPDESPQFVSHVAKTTGAAVVRPSLRTSREQFTIEGKRYEGLVMPVRITPILDGDTDLGLQLIVNVQKLELPGQRSLFRAQTTVDTKPVRIRVLAIPRTGRLPGFTGAIGKFTVAQPKVSATEVEAGEPVTLTVAMAGEGNLEGVAAPEMESAAGWQIYKPTSEFQPDPEDNLSARAGKIFTYTLIPARAGLKATPALPFSYFDPERRAFVDITIPPVPITVKASSNPATPTEITPADTAAPAPSTPLRTVEPAMTGLAEKPGRWVRSPAPPLRGKWLILAEAAVPFTLLAMWIWRRRREYLSANPQILRRRRAHAAARRSLSRARAAARKGDRGGFLRASAGALREAASPLDSARPESLTREDVLRLLHGDAGASAVARMVLDSADAANYSHADAAGLEPRAVLPDLERAVHTLARRA